MATDSGMIDRLRRPEYTGENRCVPCTATNLVVAAALALAVPLVLPHPLAPALGAGVFVAAAAAIYLRGYLVPGTPWFTRTYFPDWLLRAFDKHPAAAAATATDGSDRDVEAVLLDAGAVDECDDVDDLCLAPGFREAWNSAIGELRTGDVPPWGLVSRIDEGLRLEDHGGPPAARDGERLVGRWPSEAALVADAAGAEVLAERYPAWADFRPAERAAVLAGLRLFVERCPACDGPAAMDEEVVQSCCRWVDVVAVTCDDCGVRLFERELTDEAPAAG